VRAQSIDSTAAFAPPDTSGLTQSFEHWVAGNWHQPNTTKLERVSYVIGASLAFSLFDYVGFNYVVFHPSNTARTVPFGYRIAQAGVQTALSYFLYKQVGLSSTVSFNLIWWTWGDDFGWYGWCNLLNPAHPWYNRSFNGLQTNGITWAGWTPVGLLRRQGTVISRDVLVTQSVIGFSLAMIID
jgi:hypothetical protein